MEQFWIGFLTAIAIVGVVAFALYSYVVWERDGKQDDYWD